jgi:hypothetical protein
MRFTAYKPNELEKSQGTVTEKSVFLDVFPFASDAS